MKGLIVSVALVSVLSSMSAWQPRATQNIPQQPSSDESLTNKEVLDMVKGGLAAEIIIAKIEASRCDFDTSPAELTEMKTVGVPDPMQ